MTDSASSRHVHPFLYLVLFLPFGAVTGYVVVALGYTLAQKGISAAAIGLLVGLSLLPQTWKFLWAPLVDTTLTRKGWYLIGALLSAAGVIGMALMAEHPEQLTLFNLVIVLASLASTFLGMSVESLTAYGASDDEKGRAGGWLQAGNLGGQGLGGGVALWLEQHLHSSWIGGFALGMAILLCCAGLVFVREPPKALHAHSASAKLTEVLQDLWAAARSRVGYLALLIVFLPIGTGAASNLWSAVADDWHASASTVALVNGVLGGLISMVGCIVGGYLCDRMDRKNAYILFGLLQVFGNLAMVWSARSEWNYALFTMLYAFTSGLNYTAFSAVTLEAIGRGAAATKYNVYASLSNIPIATVTVVDGWAHTRWGAGGMLYVESLLCGVSVLIFSLAAVLSARRAARLPS